MIAVLEWGELLTERLKLVCPVVRRNNRRDDRNVSDAASGRRPVTDGLEFQGGQEE